MGSAEGAEGAEKDEYPAHIVTVDNFGIGETDNTYSADAQVNPQGPLEGRSRVVRGGSWLIDAPLCRPADRSFGAPRGGGCIVGLRLAM